MQMKNIKLIIEYDGTAYCGWQRQKNALAIQEKIEDALEKIFGRHLRVEGASRTDSGVHAKAQVASFKMPSYCSIPLEKLIFAINTRLPFDIRIKSAQNVPLEFHPRFDTKSKIYRYTILNDTIESVFDRNFCWFIPYRLNLNLIKKEMEVLKGKHDFKSFQTKDIRERTSVRTIKDIKVLKKGRYIHILVEGDGFLYNMVRSIVGTVVDIARGKLAPGSMKKILDAENRAVAGPTAVAKGLCLLEVKY